jgi:hypothetical protein
MRCSPQAWEGTPVPPGEPTGMNQELPGPCTEAHGLCGGSIVRGIPSGNPHPGEGEGVGMVNTGESARKVVTENEPQRLRGLGQQAPEVGMSSLTCGIVDHRPPGRQQAPPPTDSGSGTWEPRTSPAGNASRQASRQMCGWRRSETAKAILSWGGYGSPCDPARKGADVRRVLRRETGDDRQPRRMMDWRSVVSAPGTFSHVPSAGCALSSRQNRGGHDRAQHRP